MRGSGGSSQVGLNGNRSRLAGLHHQRSQCGGSPKRHLIPPLNAAGTQPHVRIKQHLQAGRLAQVLEEIHPFSCGKPCLAPLTNFGSRPEYNLLGSTFNAMPCSSRTDLEQVLCERLSPAVDGLHFVDALGPVRLCRAITSSRLCLKFWSTL